LQAGRTRLLHHNRRFRILRNAKLQILAILAAGAALGHGAAAGKFTTCAPAVFNLQWDPREQHDILFNGAAPTQGGLKTSHGRFAGADHG
jgi:hypothetical protein